MTSKCTLHVGMPKTGSTSIQEAFFYHLNPPGFQYAGFGEPNGSWGIGAIFSDYPEQQMALLARTTVERLGDYRRTRLARLERSIRHARHRGNNLVISAELLYGSSTATYERIRRFLNERGFEVEVLAYMRPWRSYLQSRLQQRLKNGRTHPDLDFNNPYPFLNFRERIESLWQVYGRDRVSFVKFSPADFPDRCVVKDFCQRLGIRWPGIKLPYSNVGLSLPATRLVFAYNRFSPLGISEDCIRPKRYLLMMDRLASLTGPAFQLHSSLYESIHQKIRPDLAWIEQQLGFSVDEDITRSDNGPCIKNEADLLNFEDRDLEWLARETGQPTIRRGDRTATAQAVGKQMDRLRRRLPSRSELLAWMKTRCRDPYITWRYFR